MMNVQRPSNVTHSHLLEMTMLSQRAVDTAIKSYEWKSLECCKAVLNAKEEWEQVQRGVGDRGRMFRAAGRPVDFDSPFACCALRIYGALRVTHTAATQIAHNTLLMLEGGAVRPSLQIKEMGHHVNSLVRLYTVALFTKEVKHAATVLENAKIPDSFYLRNYLAKNGVCEGDGATVPLEIEIIRSLGQIAEEAFEIGEAIVRWLEDYDCRGSQRKHSGRRTQIHVDDETPAELASTRNDFLLAVGF